MTQCPAMKRLLSSSPIPKLLQRTAIRSPAYERDLNCQGRGEDAVFGAETRTGRVGLFSGYPSFFYYYLVLALAWGFRLSSCLFC